MGECCLQGVYHRREPHLSPLYQVVEDYYEEFERCYDDRYERQYGYCLPPIFVQGGSNKSRGMRKKQETSQELQVIEPVLYPKGHH